MRSIVFIFSFLFSFSLFAQKVDSVKFSRESSDSLLRTKIVQYPLEPFYVFQRGIYNFDDGYYLSAITDFNLALQLARKNDNKWGLSNSELKESLGVDTAGIDRVLLFHRASAYRANEDYSAALGDVEYLENSFPGDSTLMALRAGIFSDQKLFDKAIAEYDKLVRGNPTGAYFRYLRAICYQKNNLLQKALPEFNAIIKAYPEDVDLLMRRGVIFSDLNKQEQAIGDFSRIIEINPAYSIAYSYRASAFAELKQFENAVADLSKAIALENNDHQRYCMRGNMYAYLGNYVAAVKDEEVAYSLFPDAGSYLINQIVNHINNNNFSIAKTLYTSYQQRSMFSWKEAYKMDFMESFIDVAVTDLFQRKYDIALQKLLKALSQYAMYQAGPERQSGIWIESLYTDVLFKTGWVYEQLNNQKAALAYYQQALDINHYNGAFKKAKNELERKMKLAVTVDKTPPVIELSSSRLGSSSNDKTRGTVSITGYAKDISGISRVSIDGFIVDTLDVESGYFAIRYPFNQNLIKIEAIDRKGNQTQRNIDLTKIKIEQHFEAKPKYHAILIANSHYKEYTNMDSLPYTIPEADSLALMLQNHYSFEKENIHPLYDLGGKALLSNLSSLLIGMKSNDHVVIFYGGHGTVMASASCWVPVDARDKFDYITPYNIVVALDNCLSSNVLVISDACFSDGMLKDFASMPTNTNLAAGKSWLAISSGKGVVSGKSTFLPAFKNVLKNNTEKRLSIQKLYLDIKTLLNKGGVSDPNQLPVLMSFKGKANGVNFIFNRK